MSVFVPGDKVIFSEPGWTLTGKRGTVLHATMLNVTVEFEEDRGTSAWRASFFSLAPDPTSSTPPAPPTCGAV